MTHETVNDVLEHFGVKGMKWGVRKSRQSSESDGGDGKSGLSRNKKIVIASAVGVGVGVAAIAIARSRGVTLSSIRSGSTTAKGAKAASNALRSAGSTSAKSIPKSRPLTSAERSLVGNHAQHRQMIRNLQSNHLRIVQEANAGLRISDNRLQIPFPQRSYLTEPIYG
jgi:hypothetical protein